MSDAPTSPLADEEKAAFLVSVDRVRTAATRALRGPAGEAATIGFVRHLQRGIDDVVDRARHAGRRIDCAAGCSHCCHARVEATAPEIFAIVDEIARREPAERQAIVARLDAAAAAVPNHGPSWSTRPACALLVDHLCSVYAVRPAACRKAHSTDVERCATGASTIPQDLGVAMEAEALMHGTAQAYAEVGFDASSQELVTGLRAALADASLRRRWLSGESIVGSM